MRICFCIDKLEGGGAERVLSNLANWFATFGHDVSIIETSSKKWCCFYEINSSINHVYLLDYSTKKVGHTKKIILLRKVIKEIKPDIVISFKYHTNINVFFSLLGLKIKHIVSERNNPFLYDIGLTSKILKKYIFKKADGCVFQTEDARNFYFKEPNERSIVIPNPVFISEKYSFLERRNAVVFTVGRLVPQKNTKMLIDAFNKVFDVHPEYILKIYGSGPLESELKDYCSKLPSNRNIYFCGVSKTWHSIEKKSHIFVLSSDYEGMPNALMEAMALGIPSISTNCPIGGPKSLINNRKNGILIPVGDNEMLAQAINELIDDANLSATLSKSNSNFSDFYSCERIARIWLDFVKMIVDKK